MKKMILAVTLVATFISINAQDTTRLSLLFGGDVMGHDSQIASAYDPVRKVYDYTSCFQFIKPYIETADLAISNLEVTLAGPPHKGYPQFSSPDALASDLKKSGWDVLVTSNNHCVDRGLQGLERTIDILDKLDIPHTGTFKDSADRAAHYPLMLHKNGFTIALLNYTFSTNGLPVSKPNIVNMIDTAKIHRDLRVARSKNPDVIIVFTHWGVEYQSLPSKSQKDVTEFCFKHGATMVIGAHPHVIQPMEWRKDKNQFVVYSLGNYVSGQRKRYTDGGALAYLELEKVMYAPDSSQTRIDSAAYYLQWVHRTVDANKDYYVLPVPATESNVKFIKDETSRAAYAMFVSDSRALYTRHNKAVSEIKTTPSDEVIYKVLLATTGATEEPWNILTSQQAYVWGVDREKLSDGSVRWLSGKFNSRAKAEVYRQRYISQHPGATIVAYRNGIETDQP
jgi:poly-gamma-glutamate capsule biosynthesis protein CapA/YwtB (metallophosphatase superfamily)